MNSVNKKIVKILIKKKIKISFAESCTGGLLSNAITSIPGSSKVFKAGLVVYSNESKIKILKIHKKMINKYGAVSKEVCKAMTLNVSKITNTNMSASITGIAGPAGSTNKKPIGLVYLGIKKGNKITVKKFFFRNRGRLYIQRKAANKCLSLILNILK